jgi:hypothetical protein
MHASPEGQAVPRKTLLLRKQLGEISIFFDAQQSACVLISILLSLVPRIACVEADARVERRLATSNLKRSQRTFRRISVPFDTKPLFFLAH